MLPSLNAFVIGYPVQTVAAGSPLLQRTRTPECALFIESGRVQLGVAAGSGWSDDEDSPGPCSLEHQLGMVQGPAWLEVSAAVLELPSAVDAIAETAVSLRRVPLADFRTSLSLAGEAAMDVLLDMARAHRQQTQLAVSRLAKDAEARCAEWLLQQVESSEKGTASVQLQQRKRLIAAQLGIAPETLSRVLRQLRDRKLISGSGRIVNLVDPGGLRSLAGI